MTVPFSSAACSTLLVLFVAVTTSCSLFSIITPCDAATNVVHYDPTVPLTHCMTFGPLSDYQFEWSIDSAVTKTLQMRFTANVQRGYSTFGFTHTDKVQLVSGYPPESLGCARRLYDNFSPYNLAGDVYPSYPETPANEIITNISHVSHFVMRNLSTNAKQMLDSGGTLSTKVTLMWGYALESMYSDACYNFDMNGTTEFAEMNITFTDSAYKKVNGTCVTYSGTMKSFRDLPQLTTTLLESEINQNTRIAGLLIGGDMLLQTGKGSPEYNIPPGFVEAGENYGNVCQSSLHSLKMRWGGFVEKVGGIQRYEVTAGTEARPSAYLDRFDVSTNEGYTFGGLTMTKNETLYVKLDAINFAGLTTTVTLPAIRVLNSNEPVFGYVLDGTVAETLDGTVTLRYVRSTTTLSAHWRDYMLHDHNAIDANTSVYTELGYEYGIGVSGQDPGSFLPFVSVPGVFETEKVVSSLALTHGITYYWTIRSTNCAGVQVMGHSPGITVDVVPPHRGKVYFSNTSFVHRSKINRGTHFAVNWYGFSDPTSGVSFYEYAIGKTPKPVDDMSNLGMIVNWTAMGTETRALTTTSVYSLPPVLQALVPLGTNLFAYVKATDRAGNWVISYSNATTVDTE